MAIERNTLPLDTLDNDELSVADVAGNNDDNQPLTREQIKNVKKTSDAAGFPRRTARRRRPAKSPHTQQITVRVQPKFAKAFRHFSDTQAIYDHETFERAMIALLEKENRTDDLNRLRTRS